MWLWLLRVSVGIEHIEDIKVGALLTPSLFRT
jgi:O-acetylhomoserine/O-acetylserine sulfhydrylase-like pyridoxal-dependent enzyme